MRLSIIMGAVMSLKLLVLVAEKPFVCSVPKGDASAAFLFANFEQLLRCRNGWLS